MIIPSIDIMAGQAVQLVGGETLAIAGGSPDGWLDRFSLASEVAIIDLDAARGEGTNAGVIQRLIRRAPCRVGGGIRSENVARQWLDVGARQIIVGTAAEPEFLRALPRERVIAALDARGGEVMVEGWRRPTGRALLSRIVELRELVQGFLVTFIEREGRLQGTDLAFAREVVAAAGSARVTIAGGVSTPEEVAALDAIGADAQVGMALYSEKMSYVDAWMSVLKGDSWPTVVVDESGVALGLAWSSRRSLGEAFRMRRGVYESRRRGLWVKGETSGAVQELLRVDADCDRDALRFVVRQQGSGFCHNGSRTCWGDWFDLSALHKRIGELGSSVNSPGYTRRLWGDEELLNDKIVEEAAELVEARGRDEVRWEAADLLYFTLVKLAKTGVSLAEVMSELEMRQRKVTRRGGESKRGASSENPARGR